MNASEALTKYTWIGYASFRSSMAYISEVATRCVFMAVVLFIFAQLWTAAYASAGSRVGDLTLPQMLWYLTIAESIQLSAYRVATEVDEDVRTGRLSIQLLRPVSYTFARMAQAIGERVVRFALNLGVGSIVVWFLVGPIRITAIGALMFVVALPIAFAIDFLGNFAVGLGAFWMESTVGLQIAYSRMSMLLGGLMMPIDVFPVAVQPILRALPFAGIMYGPARLFVTGDPSVFRFTMVSQTGALAVFGAIVWVIQHAAMRRIQNHGG